RELVHAAALALTALDPAGARVRPRFRSKSEPGPLVAGAYAELLAGATSDAVSGSPGSSRGSHWSHRGRYQFHSPSSFMLAGRSTARTIVASIRIATDTPTPTCLKNSIERVAKIENTSTITIAALVTTPAVRLMPFEIASSMLSPRS